MGGCVPPSQDTFVRILVDPQELRVLSHKWQEAVQDLNQIQMLVLATAVNVDWELSSRYTLDESLVQLKSLLIELLDQSFAMAEQLVDLAARFEEAESFSANSLSQVSGYWLEDIGKNWKALKPGLTTFQNHSVQSYWQIGSIISSKRVPLNSFSSVPSFKRIDHD
jgi:hypothetical protein